MRQAGAAALAALALLALVLVPAAEAKRVRVFAAGPRFDLAWVESREAFRAKLGALLDASRRGSGAAAMQRGADDVASHRLGPSDPARPVQTARDLVTLPEDLGLMASFTGTQGIVARSAPDLTTAIASLLVSYAPGVAHYTARWPELLARPFPPTRALALALTDTFGRVAVETFAELADRLDVWMVTGVAMAQDWRVVCVSKATMPELPGGVGCDAEDPAAVALLRSPDEPARTYAYQATSPKPSTMALVFDPDGRLVSKQVKTYLTPVELPGQLDLVPGDVSEGLSAVRTPVGVLGVVTSKDAWMPDVTQKLDQRGVEVLVQPEFFVNDVVGGDGPWAPDTLASSGFADLLRHPSIEALALPELVGNVFDFSADAQHAVAVKPRSTRSAPRGSLVGQPPTPGWADVTAWVVPDPLREDEPAAERRARLAAAGRALLPGGPPCPDPGVPGPCVGGQVEGVAFADVQVDRERRHRRQPRRRAVRPFTSNRPVAPAARAQRNVALAARGASVWAAFEERRGGRWRAVVARSTDHGARWSAPVALPGRGDQWWPAVAAGPGREVWAAWQEGDRVRVALSRDGGRRFGGPLTAPGAARQWRPGIVATGRGRAVVAWVDERFAFAAEPGLPQAGVVTAVVGDGRVGEPQRLDGPTTAPLAASMDHAWAPSLAVRGDDVLATWVDFADYDWDVRSRRSRDGGVTWEAGEVVNDTPAELEALDDRPQAALLRGGAPLIAWTDWRKDPETVRRPSRLHDTVVGRPGSSHLQVDGEGQAHRSTFSPALAALRDGGAVVAWQAHTEGPGDIRAARVSGDLRPGRVLRVDDSGRAGWNQWRPAVAVTSRRVVVAWEDERDGPVQVFVARAAPERLR